MKQPINGLYFATCTHQIRGKKSNKKLFRRLAMSLFSAL